MNERNIMIAGGIVGAIAGVVASYLFFTEEGRRYRVQAEQNLVTLMQEGEKLLAAADQVRQSVADLRGAQGYPRPA